MNITGISTDRQLKSRQTLTELLEQQIDRNQELETENLQLEEEQRRLLLIIQNKMEEIARLQEGKPLSDSTLEMTMRDNVDRSASLELIVKEKEAQIQKLRSYYTSVIQKIEQEHINQLEKYQSQNSQRLKSELKKRKDEIEGLQLTLLRGNQKVRQLSQELIVCQKELQEYRRNEGQGMETKIQLLKLNEQFKISEKDWKEKLLSQEVEYEEKMSKMKWEYEQMLARSKRESQQKMRIIRSQSEQQIRKMKSEHDERINFMIVRGEQQKQQIRQQLQEEAKICIMSELEQQEQYNKSKYKDMQVQLKQLKEKMESMALSKQSLEQQKETLQKNLKQMSSIKTQLQYSLKKTKSQVEESKATIKKLEQKLTENRQNGQYLQIASRKAQQQIKDLTDKIARLTTQNNRIGNSLKKSNSDNAELKTLNMELENARLTLQTQLEECKDKVEETVMKMGRQLEKKDKTINELRKLSQQQQEQMQHLNTIASEAQIHSSQLQQHYNDSLSTLQSSIQEKEVQNQCLLRQNKKIKEEVERLNLTVRNKFEEMTVLNDQLKSKNQQNQTNLKNISSERDNYRKLYEGNTVQLNRAKEKIVKLDDKVSQIATKLNNSEQEIQYLKEEIGRYQLEELEKAELERVRDQNVELRARVANNNDKMEKLKEERSDLTKDVLILHEENDKLANQIEKWVLKDNQWRTEKSRLESQVKELEAELDERCKKLESELPYINTLIEQKKKIEIQFNRISGQLKKKDHLLEKAKRSKAEEFVTLQREGADLKKKEKKMEEEQQDLKKTLQTLNREKVNIMRESTEREDIMRRIEKQNRVLKGEIKKLQLTCDQQQVQIQSLYHMLSEYNKEQI